MTTTGQLPRVPLSTTDTLYVKYWLYEEPWLVARSQSERNSAVCQIGQFVRTLCFVTYALD